MDVKNALLNGSLREEVYMVPSLGVSYNPKEVCKLRKVFYNLKQASQAWFENFLQLLHLLDYFLMIVTLVCL